MVKEVIGSTPKIKPDNKEAFKEVEKDMKKVIDKAVEKLDKVPEQVVAKKSVVDVKEDAGKIENAVKAPPEQIGTIIVKIYKRENPVADFDGEITANIVKYVGTRLLWRAYRRWCEAKSPKQEK